MPGSIIATILTEFKDFLQKSTESGKIVSSTDVENFTSSLASFLSAIGGKVLCSLLQSLQPSSNKIVHEGVEFVYVKDEPKRYATLFGKIEISRRYYWNKQLRRACVPLDELWNMKGRFATPEICERIAYLTGFLSPATISEVFKRFGSCRLSTSFIRKIGEIVGETMERESCKIIEEAHKTETQLPNDANCVAVSLDGVNMMLREKGTLGRRPYKRPGHESLVESGNTCYKNAGVGTISFYGSEGEGDDQTVIRKRTVVVAHTPEERMKSLKKEMEGEVVHWLRVAERNEQNVKKVVVMDGARNLWTYIEQSELYKGWIQIVDFHHCCEHLSKFAEKLFGSNRRKGQRWYLKCRAKLLNYTDGVNRIIRSAEYYLMKTNKSNLASQLEYFRKNRQRMQYKTFREQGLPIGSGPVEAACKTIIKARLCCSGMRWSRKRAQGVLRIRTMIKNKRWDVAWKTYLATTN